MNFELCKAQRKMISMHSIFSPDDTKFFTIMSSKVVVRDSKTLERIVEIPIKNAAFIHFSKDGKKIFINNTSGSVYIYETELFKCEKVLRSTKARSLMDSDFFVDDAGVNLFVEMSSEIALMTYIMDEDDWQTRENFAGSSVSFQTLNEDTVLFIVCQGEEGCYVVENKVNSGEFKKHRLSDAIEHKSFFLHEDKYYSYYNTLTQLKEVNDELVLGNDSVIDSINLVEDETIKDVLVASTIDLIVITTSNRTILTSKDFTVLQDIDVPNCTAATINHAEDLIIINSEDDSLAIKITH